MVERPIKRSEQAEGSSKPKPVLRSERGESPQEQGENHQEPGENRWEQSGRGERSNRGERSGRGEKGERGKGRGKGRSDREEKVPPVPLALMRGPKPQPKVELPEPEMPEEPPEETSDAPVGKAITDGEGPEET